MFVSGNLVMEDGVSMREGTSLNILARNADMVALAQERAEGKSLSGGPIDTLMRLAYGNR